MIRLAKEQMLLITGKLLFYLNCFSADKVSIVFSYHRNTKAFSPLIRNKALLITCEPPPGRL